MHLVDNLKVLVQLSRPQTATLILLQGVASYLFLTDNYPLVGKVILAVIMLVFVYINAVAINDLSDQEVDRINLNSTNRKKNRPIINGTATPHRVIVLVVMSCLVVLVTSYFIVWWLVLVALSMLILNAIYSLPPIRISYRGVLAQLLLPIVYVALPAILAFSISDSLAGGRFLVFVSGLYILFTGRLFLKDIRDVEGDRQVGKRTFIVRHGLEATIKQSFFWIVTGLVMSLVGLVMRPEFEPADLIIYLPALTVVIAGSLKSLHECYKSRRLDEQLLYIASTGRWASMWLFVICVDLLVKYQSVGMLERVLMGGFAIAMFAAGQLLLKEEIASMKAKLSVN